MRSVSARPWSEKALRHISEFLREFLDRAMHQGCSTDIVADQRLVERGLADRLGGFTAERVLAVFLQRLRKLSRICRNAPLLARSRESRRRPSTRY